MSGIHPLKTNTSLPCVNCGGPGNVVREANVPEDKKLKCEQCKFMYTAADSLAAIDAGAIPDGPPELDHTQSYDVKPEVDSRDFRPTENGRATSGKIPRKPTFVLVSKDRTQSEFAGAKDVKQVILRWEYESRKFDLFELTPKQATTKVELQ